MMLADVPARENLLIKVSTGEKSMELQANIIGHLKNNLTVVSIGGYEDKKLNFSTVNVELEYQGENSVPITFKNVTIQSYKDKYIINSPKKGTKVNRRGYFRVPVGVYGVIKIDGKASSTVVKDVSMTGFAITDRTKELNLSKGTRAVLKFTDITFELTLEGELVRIEDNESSAVYGFQITNICKDLQYYIGLKQRKRSQ